MATDYMAQVEKQLKENNVSKEMRELILGTVRGYGQQRYNTGYEDGYADGKKETPI